jgi:hypothetical protein
MKRCLKLAVFVVLGVTATAALVLVQHFAISVGVPEPGSDAGFSLFLTWIFSLVVGGGITGYLSSQYLKTKRGLVYVTPGLYFLLLEAGVFVYFADRMMPGLPEMMLVFGILTFLVSWAGVGAGHYIRCEILKDKCNQDERNVPS